MHLEILDTNTMANMKAVMKTYFLTIQTVSTWCNQNCSVMESQDNIQAFYKLKSMLHFSFKKNERDNVSKKGEADNSANKMITTSVFKILFFT